MSKPMSLPTGHKDSCFFCVAALAIYTQEGEEKSRHLNVLLETPSANLSKSHLGEMQKQILRRLEAENQIMLHDVKDVVILNISLMGVMPTAEFMGQDSPVIQ